MFPTLAFEKGVILSWYFHGTFYQTFFLYYGILCGLNFNKCKKTTFSSKLSFLQKLFELKTIWHRKVKTSILYDYFIKTNLKLYHVNSWRKPSWIEKIWIKVVFCDKNCFFYPFWVNLTKKNQIVYLNSNLISRLIRICLTRLWYAEFNSLFLFQSENTFKN